MVTKSKNTHGRSVGVVLVWKEQRAERRGRIDLLQQCLALIMCVCPPPLSLLLLYIKQAGLDYNNLDPKQEKREAKAKAYAAYLETNTGMWDDADLADTPVDQLTALLTILPSFASSSSGAVVSVAGTGRSGAAGAGAGARGGGNTAKSGGGGACAGGAEGVVATSVLTTAQANAALLVNSRPAAGRPVVGRPVVRRPVVGRPVVGRPVVGRPVVGRPVAAQQQGGP
jgi:hypothetical protein